MFIDIATIKVKAGNGGNGAVAFHREKFVAAGGPSGGDGGRGGSVVLEADANLATLMDLQYRKKYVAPNGEDGGQKKMEGKDGDDLVIRVPVGTLVKDANTEKIIADLSEPGTRFVAARGGNGGWGNARFATPTRQAPSFAKSGQVGQSRDIVLEVKLIADVGLIGFPNVGKSTLLSVVSDARPKIANYHFTTLVPNLGVVRIGDGHMVLADIPGIIEGASEGVGLGHDFLRHVERTRLLIHVVDVSGCEGRDPLEDFRLINEELQKYSPVLAQKPQLVAANKTDVSTEQLQHFTEQLTAQGYRVFPLSAATNQGVKELMSEAFEQLRNIPATQFEVEEVAPDEHKIDETFEITIDDEGAYVVVGEGVEHLVRSTNFGSSDSFAYFQRMLRQKGVIEALEKMHIMDGETVRIGDLEFDYYH